MPFIMPNRHQTISWRSNSRYKLNIILSQRKHSPSLFDQGFSFKFTLMDDAYERYMALRIININYEERDFPAICRDLGNFMDAFGRLPENVQHRLIQDIRQVFHDRSLNRYIICYLV